MEVVKAGISPEERSRLLWEVCIKYAHKIFARLQCQITFYEESTIECVHKIYTCLQWHCPLQWVWIVIRNLKWSRYFAFSVCNA